MVDIEDAKPPPIVRKPIADRIYRVPNNWRNAWRRKMEFVHYLSSPFIGSRLRDDSIILANF